MQRVILDVDTGIDDALAISYAIRSPQLDVLGITTGFGNVSVDDATRNSYHVLKQFDVDIPVAKGAHQPLFRHRTKVYSTHFHGDNGLANRSVSDTQQTNLDATQLIHKQVKKYPHEVTLICLGSLTNLAVTLMQEPEIATLLKEVVVMGGAVQVPGNHQMLAEANIYADPEAAEYVFQSKAKITMVGLDVTMQTALKRNQIQHWYQKSTAHQFLAEIIDFYIDGYRKFYQDRDYCALHDPLAVAVAIDSSIVKREPMVIHVDLEGHYSYGRTVADLRVRSTETPNVMVCTDVDATRFLDHFLDTLDQANE